MSCAYRAGPLWLAEHEHGACALYGRRSEVHRTDMQTVCIIKHEESNRPEIDVEVNGVRSELRGHREKKVIPEYGDVLVSVYNSDV